jgi:hypothetical protein
MGAVALRTVGAVMCSASEAAWRKASGEAVAGRMFNGDQFNVGQSAQHVRHAVLRAINDVINDVVSPDPLHSPKHR